MESNTTGAGPYTFELPALAPDEAWRINFNKYQKGRYRSESPFEAMLVKNYDTGNRIVVEVNGGAKNRNVDVDPGGKDEYDQVGIARLLVRNVGGSTIAADDVTVTVKSDPYGADELAREQRERGTVRRVVEHFTGL